MDGKRTLRTLPIEIKAKAIRLIQSGKSRREVVKKFNVPRQTLNSWIKNSTNILNSVDRAEFTSDRRRLTKGNYGVIEDCLLNWLRNARSKNVPITRPMLMMKAAQFADELRVSNFKCNDSWIDRFRARYNIRSMKEKDSNKLNEWKNSLTFRSILREYKPRDIYNLDELGLFWKMLPNKTLAFKNGLCKSNKPEERLTVILMANMDGSDKRRLTVIGKSDDPRASLKDKGLPVDYTRTESAWMTGSVFEKLLKTFDQEMTEQNRKVALIVDNCATHVLVSGLKAVRLQFLPPNTPNHAQPMNAGVIQNFKTFYRQLLVSRLCTNTVGERAFAPDLPLAIGLMREAWDLVKPETIGNCFYRCGFIASDSGSPRENDVLRDHEDILKFNTIRNRLVELFQWPDTLSVEEFVNFDNCILTNNSNVDEAIVAAVKNPSVVKEDDDDEEDTDEDESEEEQEETTEPVVTLAEAIAALDKVRLFLSQLS